MRMSQGRNRLSVLPKTNVRLLVRTVGPLTVAHALSLLMMTMSSGRSRAHANQCYQQTNSTVTLHRAFAKWALHLLHLLWIVVLQPEVLFTVQMDTIAYVIFLRFGNVQMRKTKHSVASL